jgi:hypothetical protein
LSCAWFFVLLFLYFQSLPFLLTQSAPAGKMTQKSSVAL